MYNIGIMSSVIITQLGRKVGQFLTALAMWTTLDISKDTQLCVNGCCVLKHDGTVPTCFNQSKASISFDYINTPCDDLSRIPVDSYIIVVF